MFTVKSGFMGDFKLGDNINYSLRVLSILYKYQSESTSGEQTLLCKPITVLIASICEASTVRLSFANSNVQN